MKYYLLMAVMLLTSAAVWCQDWIKQYDNYDDFANGLALVSKVAARRDESETVLPLCQASAHPLLRQGRRRGRPINRSTLERWRTRGVRGPGGETVVLETALIGAGIRATTVEALERFFAKLNGSEPASEQTPSQLRRQHERDETELIEAGM